MTALSEAVSRLRQEARPDQLAGRERYGMVEQDRLSLSMPVIRKIAREFGCDHGLAFALWQTGLAEARIVASIIAAARRLFCALECIGCAARAMQ